jgi:hypothetical protein
MTRFALTVLLASALAAPALAFPVDGLYMDGPDCDNHGNQFAVDELGNSAIFPADELIDAEAIFTEDVACSMTDDPAIANALIRMTNLSGRDLADLYYVADPQTTFSNVDGFATTALVPSPDDFLTAAFRIDDQGANRNLIFESISADGVFQAGETWQFIVQDFQNTLGLGPAALGSLDFAGGSFGDQISAASIVQFVPAPGAGALFGLSVLAAARRRRD